MSSYSGRSMPKTIGGIVVAATIALSAVGLYWSIEPDTWDVKERAMETAAAQGAQPVVGYVTVSTLIDLADTLLTKPGGYLTNDVTPPGILMDNMPNWEFGVLVQVRDMARAMRKDIARSQSTSVEDKDLAEAEPLFNFNNSSWMFPQTEDEYRKGIKHLESYRERMVNPGRSPAQFYARADNLRNWLSDVGTRLGSISQRLSASVGKNEASSPVGDATLPDSGDASNSGEPQPMAHTQEAGSVKTSWFKIDDVFYEARGTTFALLQLLKAVQIDFNDVLVSKNADISMAQIIKELERTQDTVYSPVILNGRGFGFTANHSLVMANYISRASTAILDIRDLLSQG